MPQNWREPSVLLLYWVNLIPVIGVLFFDWGLAIILALYWLETVFIGVLNVPKILMCRGGVFEGGISLFGNLFNAAFFSIHFGGFSYGHLTALNHMIGVKNIFAYFTENPLFWIAIGSLMISHIFSFWHNFLRRKEYSRRSSSEQMFKPYGRVVVMHLIIIFGGLLLMQTGSPDLLLIVLVAIKIVIDGWLHLRSHKPIIISP
ncbi:MAG: hypothetical protein HKN36_04970 [Hellea sp.]|nr:hypothetical protein [Hellea sp.]